MNKQRMTAEEQRLADNTTHKVFWKKWGPYLSERQWGTVREDYSENGDAWNFFPHDHARSRVYRWGEDGLAGISDIQQNLCFALALWNGKDPILKERLFGLNGSEGNHGEDVKELYYYLDNTPTHSYMKFLYKYPQEEYPYRDLVETNRDRSRLEPEYELSDTGIFDEYKYMGIRLTLVHTIYSGVNLTSIVPKISNRNRAKRFFSGEILFKLKHSLGIIFHPNILHLGGTRVKRIPIYKYFDVFVEYAKADHEDILIRLQIVNRSNVKAEITVLPTLWFRNTWSFEKVKTKPDIQLVKRVSDWDVLEATHEEIGTYYLHCEKGDVILFTENETNTERLFGSPNSSPFVKDAFHDVIIHKDNDLLRGKRNGTKSAVVYRFELPGGKSKTIKLRLSNRKMDKNPFDNKFEEIVKQRIDEADAFYAQFLPKNPVSDASLVQRQAFAGMLWSKQYYNYEIETWLNGDKGQPPPPEKRKDWYGRNYEWKHLFNRDILSMPDKWEYPWYAVWDLGFHCIPLAMIDPDFAKKQLILILREWYMHPNGQLPAYEWDFGDVNPPVNAWAALKVYQIEKSHKGKGDIDFLKRVFHKLMLNFTWWVNRKDMHGNNIFQGGFLGLDNIGVFDRSHELPTGGHLDQADGTSWMAMYSLVLMEMAMEIALKDPTYDDVASKFFEHFVHIAESLNLFDGHHDVHLWNEEDGFFYDTLHFPDCSVLPLRVRSLVGLVGMFAVTVIKKEALIALKGFTKRMLWFKNNRENLHRYLVIEELKEGQDCLLSLINKDKLIRILQKILDENEFLSPGGIRSVSKYHEEHPFTLRVNGDEYRVDYEPAESKTGLFGGNSNWRGPIWIPMNYLLIDALKKFYQYYGETLKVEFPTGSNNYVNLWEVAKKLSQRITGVFMKDENGKRPVHGDEERYQKDPDFKDLVLFHEYFHGDTWKGLGASHQTGWTGIVAEMIEWCWCK